MFGYAAAAQHERLSQNQAIRNGRSDVPVSAELRMHAKKAVPGAYLPTGSYR